MTTKEPQTALAERVEGLARLVERLADLKRTSDAALKNSQGLADHKLLILANYGALALDMAPAFEAALRSRGGSHEQG